MIDEPPSEEDCSDSNLRLPHRKASNPRYCQQCEIDVLTAQLAAATLRADRAEEALRQIASCTSFHPGDVVDIARTTLATLDADQEAAE